MDSVSESSWAQVNVTKLIHLQDLPTLRSLRAELWFSISTPSNFCKTGKPQELQRQRHHRENTICKVYSTPAVIQGQFTASNCTSRSWKKLKHILKYPKEHLQQITAALAFQLSKTFLVIVDTDLTWPRIYNSTQYPPKDIIWLKAIFSGGLLQVSPIRLWGFLGVVREYKSGQH